MDFNVVMALSSPPIWAYVNGRGKWGYFEGDGSVTWGWYFTVVLPLTNKYGGEMVEVIGSTLLLLLLLLSLSESLLRLSGKSSSISVIIAVVSSYVICRPGYIRPISSEILAIFFMVSSMFCGDFVKNDTD